MNRPIQPSKPSSALLRGEQKPGPENTHSPVAEQIEASVKGQDAPLEESRPTAPGALVWFTYPALLIVLLLTILMAINFIRGS